MLFGNALKVQKWGESRISLVARAAAMDQIYLSFRNIETSHAGNCKMHVFISHASNDRSHIQRLLDELELRRVALWIAPDNISPSDEYSAAIEAGIRNSWAVFCIISIDGNKSREVLKEIELANKWKKPILAILLGKTIEPTGGLSYHLSSTQWIRLLDDEQQLYQTYDKILLFLRSVSLGSKGRVSWGASTAAIQPEFDRAATTVKEVRDRFQIEYKPEKFGSRSPLALGSIINSFRIEALLSHSESGFTYLCSKSDLSKRQYVIKELCPSQLTRRTEGNHRIEWLVSRWSKARALRLRTFTNELTLKNPLIRAGLAPYTNKLSKNGTIYLWKTYQQGQTLRRYMDTRIGTFSAIEVRDLFLQILALVKRLHDNGLSHGDIQPGNLLIRPAAPPTVIDFVTATRLTQKAEVISYTAGFSPPDILERLDCPFTSRTRRQTDLYMTAACAYTMFCGQTVDRSVVRDELNKLVQREFVPWQLVGAIGWCLSTDARRRPDDVAQVLNMAMCQEIDAQEPALTRKDISANQFSRNEVFDNIINI